MRAVPSLRPLARAAPAQPERHAFPWLPLALGLLLVGGCAGGAFVVVRRRPRAPAPDEIEAELQELIAEERARQVGAGRG